MAKAKSAQARKKLGGARTGDGSGPREDKVRAVSELQEQLSGSNAVLLSEYRGLTVAELKELRTSLGEVSADYKVYKNTLAAIAARNLGLEGLLGFFEGPTAFTFAQGDPVVAAKKLSEFAKRVPALVLKGGLLGERILTSNDADSLAKLESREAMLAKVAGMFQSPIQQLANLFAAPLNQVGSLLAQLRDKVEAEGGAVPEPQPGSASEGTGSEDAAPSTEHVEQEAVVSEPEPGSEQGDAAQAVDGGEPAAAEETTEG